MFTPVLVWNARARLGLVSVSGRPCGGSLQPAGPVLTLAGGALFLLPWIWLPLIVCGFDALRRGPADRGSWLLVCLAAPAHCLFHAGLVVEPGAVSLGRTRLPDAAAVARRRHRPPREAAADGLSRPERSSSSVRRSSAARCGSTGCRVVIGNFRPGKDPALAAVDWTSLRQELAERGLLDRPGLVVAATRWLDAGKIDYALGGRVPVICLGQRSTRIRDHRAGCRSCRRGCPDRCPSASRQPLSSSTSGDFSTRSIPWRRPRCCMTGARH